MAPLLDLLVSGRLGTIRVLRQHNFGLFLTHPVCQHKQNIPTNWKNWTFSDPFSIFLTPQSLTLIVLSHFRPQPPEKWTLFMRAPYNYSTKTFLPKNSYNIYTVLSLISLDISALCTFE